jgi:hypothetical protein
MKQLQHARDGRRRGLPRLDDHHVSGGPDWREGGVRLLTTDRLANAVLAVHRKALGICRATDSGFRQLAKSSAHWSLTEVKARTVGCAVERTRARLAGTQLSRRDALALLTREPARRAPGSLSAIGRERPANRGGLVHVDAHVERASANPSSCSETHRAVGGKWGGSSGASQNARAEQVRLYQPRHGWTLSLCMVTGLELCWPEPCATPSWRGRFETAVRHLPARGSMPQ